MTSWPKRARLGLAVFAIGFAAVVYWSTGRRQTVASPPAITRLDPKAVVETTASEHLQTSGNERKFEVKWKRSVVYEDGSAKYDQVEITVPRPGGRFFVIAAKEALAAPKQAEYQLAGEVAVSGNDGFRLRTDRATVDREANTVGTPGEFSFEKGRMSGTGRDGVYDSEHDVLRIAERAHVTARDESGATTLDGTSGKAAFDRARDLLFFESTTHLQRGSETIDADRVMARLSAPGEVVTHLELRGRARVSGRDGPIESMEGGAIDLDYADDGTTVQRAVLNQQASVAMAAGEGASGKRMSGESLDLQLAPDGALTSVTARQMVSLDLPGAAAAPRRLIRAGSFDAYGEPRKGLTGARFRDNVVYQELAGPRSVSRELRARSLNASLEGDGVTGAFFSGHVRVEEDALRAAAAEISYQPLKGLLSLSGVEDGRNPSVTDDLIRVDARAIDVTLDGHGMTARGQVRTLLRPRRAAGSGPEKAQADGQLPRLLQQGEPVSINAESLDYAGGTGRAAYSGNATLVQGETAIRADDISLDQQNGNLVAAGSTRSTLTFDSGKVEGRADEIRYDEASRVLTYGTTGAAASTTGTGTRPAATRAAPPDARRAQLNGPEGDLSAVRIEVVLSRDDNRVERLEAHDEVTIVQGGRRATGARLTYHASDERYVVSGGGTTRVTFRDRQENSCSETIAQTLTFFKSTDRVVFDGRETRRTQTQPCASASSR